MALNLDFKTISFSVFVESLIKLPGLAECDRPLCLLGLCCWEGFAFLCRPGRHPGFALLALSEHGCVGAEPAPCLLCVCWVRGGVGSTPAAPGQMHLPVCRSTEPLSLLQQNPAREHPALHGYMTQDNLGDQTQQ